MKTHSTNLNFEVLPNGNLKLTATKVGKELLKESNQDVIGKWLDLLEPTSCNGSYALVHPEKLGWLTDAPIIVNYADYDDNFEFVEHEDTVYWYFNEYMIQDEFKLLLTNKPLIFERV